MAKIKKTLDFLFLCTLLVSGPAWCSSRTHSLWASPSSRSCLFRKLNCCWILSLDDNWRKDKLGEDDDYRHKILKGNYKLSFASENRLKWTKRYETHSFWSSRDRGWLFLPWQWAGSAGVLCGTPCCSPSEAPPPSHLFASGIPVVYSDWRITGA